MSQGLTKALKGQAGTLGFSMAGVVEARPGKRLAAYHQWLENGYHGRMAYLSRPDRLARREDLNVILPGVRSILCVGLDYETIQLPPHIANDPARGSISNYAWGADYHDVMTPRLQQLADWLAQQSQAETQGRVYVDTGAVLERDHAESAGLGFTGKNTMLIGPRRGSWFFLGELLTTAELTPDAPQPMPTCGSCRRCLDACPTAAFPQPYVLDSRRCISYLTIELKEWIPRELRPLMGNWVYGCDVCQSPEGAFRPGNFDAAAPPLLDLLALDEAGFQRRFANSPIKRIKRERLLRNACVAAGNWGSETAVPPLLDLLSDPSPLIRGHAAWALQQIGGERARKALAAVLEKETDEQVRAEAQIKATE
jgi:epoxyqueuosine reductase